jgi:hypothetical protein
MTVAKPMKATKGAYDDFLYATIDEEDADAPLSVLSVLARSDVDPWDEAARLAALPCDVAVTVMAKLIARLPARSIAHTPSDTLAARLIALLPAAAIAAARPVASTAVKPAT